MNLVRFNKDDFGYLPSFLEDFFGRDLFGRETIQKVTNTTFPAVNVKEDEDQFKVLVAAPGLTKEDFSISIDHNILKIASESKQESEEKDTKENFTRREYSFSQFSRAFKLPENTNVDGIEAKFENGELIISIPKATAPVPTVKQIEIQ